MRIETVSVDSLSQDSSNARGHDTGIPELVESLSKFEQQKPLVVWRDVVMAGNGLLRAALQLGWESIEINRLPDEWSRDKAMAYALADNRTAELSYWIVPVLEDQISTLTLAGWDMPSFGFEDLKINFGPKDVDDVPDAPVDPKSKIGDMFQLGSHRLICGDSTSDTTYRRLMGNDRAELIWTDPPYGVEYEGKTKNSLRIQNDGKGGLRTLLDGAFSWWTQFSIEGAAVYVAHPAGALSLVFLQAFTSQGWRLHETLVWDKQTIVLGHSDYHYSHEPILLGYLPGGGRRGRGGAGWYGDNSQRSVISVPKPSRSETHPTMKPVELVATCVKNSSRIGGVVLDPFGGSGSTLIACEQTGRHARIIEIDPRYVDVIIARWEALTGKKSKKLRIR